MLPIYYFFNFLYYTDLGSVYFVLLSFYYSLLSYDKEEGYKKINYNRLILSLLFGCVAVLFRQNNIIWLAFIFGNLILSIIDPFKISTVMQLVKQLFNNVLFIYYSYQ